MTQEFQKKLETGAPLCYLHLTDEDFKLWNFASQGFPLFDSALLFRAAARPFFDYFFPMIDFFGTEGAVNFSAVDDKQFLELLSAAKPNFLNHQETVNAGERLLAGGPKKILLITNQQRKTGLKMAAAKTIVLSGAELFGSTETVWRQIKSQMPAGTQAVVLNLGPEKFLLGPRVKLEYNLPVLDLGRPGGDQPSIIKKIRGMAKKLIIK